MQTEPHSFDPISRNSYLRRQTSRGDRGTIPCLLFGNLSKLLEYEETENRPLSPAW